MIKAFCGSRKGIELSRKRVGVHADVVRDMLFTRDVVLFDRIVPWDITYPSSSFIYANASNTKQLLSLDRKGTHTLKNLAPKSYQSWWQYERCAFSESLEKEIT